MKNYYCLEHFPDLSSRYIKEGMNATYKLNVSPNDYRAGTMFNNSNFIRSLKNLIGDVSALWIKNPPNSLYDWHIDKNVRQCSINFPINDTGGRAFYRSKLYDDVENKSLYYTLDEVKYILYKPTILNVKHEHCVMNMSNQERIILSLCVKEASYDETVAALKDVKISEY